MCCMVPRFLVVCGGGSVVKPHSKSNSNIICGNRIVEAMEPPASRRFFVTSDTNHFAVGRRILLESQVDGTTQRDRGLE